MHTREEKMALQRKPGSSVSSFELPSDTSNLLKKRWAGALLSEKCCCLGENHLEIL